MAQVPQMEAPRSAVSQVLAGAIADIWTDLRVVVGMIGYIERQGSTCYLTATPDQAYTVPLSILNDIITNGGKYQDYILYGFMPNTELGNDVPPAANLPNDKTLVDPNDPDSALRQKTWDEYLDLFSFRRVNNPNTETAFRFSTAATGRIGDSDDKALMDGAYAFTWRTLRQWDNLVETDPDWQLPT